jgi:transcriptional regulator with XRE-family HTH domain
MRDPEFQREYEALGPEFEIIKQIIDLRLKRKMSQAELAKKVGTQQPSIARMESRRQLKDLEYLQRIAQALDAKLEVRLVPRKASGTRPNTRRTSKQV